MRPVISPDGKQVAFAAVGDIYVMPVGGKPVNITNDERSTPIPRGRPTASQLVVLVGQGQRAPAAVDSRHANGPSAAGHAPDDAAAGRGLVARREAIAFFNVDGMWRVAQMSVVDVASRRRHARFTIAAAARRADLVARRQGGSRSRASRRMTRRFREGTNQVLTMPADRGRQGGHDGRARRRRHRRQATSGTRRCRLLSIDSRGGCGPVWSPDGTKMAAIYEGVLAVWPVSRDRRAARTAAPRSRPRARTRRAGRAIRGTSSISRSTSCASSTSKRARRATVPLDLKYTPAVPTGRMVVHAGKLDRHEEPRRRAPNVDIVIDGNRITQRRRARRRQSRRRQRRRRVGPHGDAGPDGVPLASAAGLRRSRRGARGWRSGSRPCAVRATRRTKRSRIAKPTRPACVRARASTAPAI